MDLEGAAVVDVAVEDVVTAAATAGGDGNKGEDIHERGSYGGQGSVATMQQDRFKERDTIAVKRSGMSVISLLFAMVNGCRHVGGSTGLENLCPSVRLTSVTPSTPE